MPCRNALLGLIKISDRCPSAPPLLIEEVRSGAIKPAGFSCSLVRLRLYPRHPHRVRGTNQTKRVGRKPALFICGLSLWPAPPAQTVEIKTRVTELLRRIEDIVSPTVVGMGYEIVRVAMSKGGTLQIMIEPSNGGPMDVEACATLSRALSAVLDVEDPIPGTYTLEVSSPGIDRPLTRPKDYTRWAGHLARVETAEPIDGRRRFKGTLLGLSDGVVRLRLDDGKETALPLGVVSKAKLEMTDALIEEHRLAQEGVGQAH
ncbi:MAG: ribosome maturation factor RimP [Reyranella sp.]|nr:ribosome maturation factor RimP [Reyranella sp.]